MSGDRFEVLYEGYSDGTLSPDERREFTDLLGDPANRARFLNLAEFESIISQELDVVVPIERPSTRSLKIRAAMVRRVPSRGGSSRFPAWGVALIGAAALLLMILAGLATGNRTPAPVRPGATDLSQSPAPRPPLEGKPAEPPLTARTAREERTPEPLVVPPPKALEKPLLKPEVPAAPIEPPERAPEPPLRAPRDPEKSTVAFIAHLEKLQGRVLVQGEAAVEGRGLRGGESVETEAGAGVSLKFGDGTRILLGAETLLAKIADAPGKSMQLERGVIAAEVEKQSKPMLVAGPHADATVLGTAFTLYAAPAFTRLDVREGRVRFSSRSGMSAVAVGAGQYAIAAAGQDLALKGSPGSWKAPGAGLLFWMKADGPLRGGAKGVSSWTDLSGLGNHGTSATTPSQPMLIDTPRPALRFDGVDDALELPSLLSDFRGGLSAFVVGRFPAGPANMRIFDFGNGPSCDNTAFGRKDGALAFWAYFKGSTRQKIEVPGAIPADQLVSLSVTALPGGRTVLYRNGAPVGAGSTSSLNGEPRKPAYIGRPCSGGEYLKGDLHEVIVYQRALSDAERQFIEAYLQVKYLDPTLPPPFGKPSEK